MNSNQCKGLNLRSNSQDMENITPENKDIDFEGTTSVRTEEEEANSGLQNTGALVEASQVIKEKPGTLPEKDACPESGDGSLPGAEETHCSNNRIFLGRQQRRNLAKKLAQMGVGRSDSQRSPKKPPIEELSKVLERSRMELANRANANGRKPAAPPNRNLAGSSAANKDAGPQDAPEQPEGSKANSASVQQLVDDKRSSNLDRAQFGFLKSFLDYQSADEIVEAECIACNKTKLFIKRDFQTGSQICCDDALNPSDFVQKQKPAWMKLNSAFLERLREKLKLKDLIDLSHFIALNRESGDKEKPDEKSNEEWEASLNQDSDQQGRQKGELVTGIAETFVEHMIEHFDDSELSADWFFDPEMEMQGILLFKHSKVSTLHIQVDFERKDFLGRNVFLKCAKVVPSGYQYKNWKASEHVLDSQLKLDLFPYLPLRRHGSKQSLVLRMLMDADNVITSGLNLVDKLSQICASNKCTLFRSDEGIFLEKDFTYVVTSRKGHKCSTKRKFSVKIWNLRLISFRDIKSPQLSMFKPSIAAMPIGVEFLERFFDSPKKYLK